MKNVLRFLAAVCIGFSAVAVGVVIQPVVAAPLFSPVHYLGANLGDCQEFETSWVGTLFCSQSFTASDDIVGFVAYVDKTGSVGVAIDTGPDFPSGGGPGSVYASWIHSSGVVCVINDGYGSTGLSGSDICTALGFPSARIFSTSDVVLDSAVLDLDFTCWVDGSGSCIVNDLQFIYYGEFATATPTATFIPSHTPTITPSPTATPLPLVGGVGSFAAWCPTEAAGFGSTFSHTWMVACGCVVGVQSPYIPTVTPSPTGTLVPTTTPPVIFTPSNTPTAVTPTVTPSPTRTSTLRPSLTPTNYLTGGNSYDAALTATAYPLYLTAVAAYTPTLSADSSGVSIASYCSVPIERASVMAVEVVNYVDTVCLPEVPAFQFAVEGLSMWGFELPDVEYENPEIAICLDRYAWPRVALFGTELPIETLAVFAMAIAWVLKGLGKL